jgi:hypothetical protein
MGRTQERAERELKERVKRAHSRAVRPPTYKEASEKKERQGLRAQAEKRSRDEAYAKGFREKSTVKKTLEDFTE